MRYIKKFKTFEGIISPTEITDNRDINSFEELVEYGNDNDFDVVNYDDFFNSLSTDDQQSAPPRNGVPFFALYHLEREKPMFVLSNEVFLRMPNFKTIVDDIISHEKIHVEQSSRAKVTYNLPDPNDRKSYFSNKDEVMAFSWSIAKGLSRTGTDLESSISNLDKMSRESHSMIWNDIKRYCDEKTINRYRKYIYLYLEEMFS